MEQIESPTLKRLNDQILWYSTKSQNAQRAYKILKALQIIIAASLPMINLFELDYGTKIASALGVILLILEGIQQLNQYQRIWITYRGVGETLKREKYLYLANAEPYRTTQTSTILLADRIENIISQEHIRWTSTQEYLSKTSTLPSSNALNANIIRTDSDSHVQQRILDKPLA